MSVTLQLSGNEIGVLYGGTSVVTTSYFEIELNQILCVCLNFRLAILICDFFGNLMSGLCVHVYISL